MNELSLERVPDAYRCSLCNSRGIKLWREAGTFEPSPALTCCACLCALYGHVFVTDEGKSESLGQWTDQLHDRVPAVPTAHQGAASPRTDAGMQSIGTYWGYTSAPPDGVAWWKALPLDLWNEDDEIPIIGEREVAGHIWKVSRDGWISRRVDRCHLDVGCYSGDYIGNLYLDDAIEPYQVGSFQTEPEAASALLKYTRSLRDALTTASTWALYRRDP